MCKVIQFRFTCHHTLRLRKSSCGGTRHKTTRNSTKAACNADAYITRTLSHDCGACQQKEWDDTWKRKLERAESFAKTLTGRGIPGTEEVAELVKQLEAQYAAAAWDMRHAFAHAHRPSVARVGISHREIALSPLSREVRPEDVVERVQFKDWAHEEYEYDGDYVASTDPMHPVDNTSYSHPLYYDDDSWVLNHLTAEEIQDEGPGVAFDFGESTWGWDDDSETPTAGSEHGKRHRQILRRHRETTDLSRYYSDWLMISRCEMRDFEGLEGRVIRDPPRMCGVVMSGSGCGQMN
ncbi:hypothetical protein P153DRAFT_346760 [Dothidotthia symphoricarpi CBS 119687]|uniref:Uncharacterized protein n=1 Tax=Dothidotthia symphoricarpi CBS 119687 TaxID=1392245 RepID=A0A6A6A1Y9_9PLEO|nr:uncharacterized protein P153DRAFT_346760 [Dothidotthia symphoricarpi CBS 119687]KAF2125992.1 hypothetical protein P153DRAFT_346760 [Dothidotthia symphoricarpi CBS 119687]